MIENGHVRLAVCPDAGRIVEFGLVGERNLLWLNASLDPEEARTKKQWLNWGGDKIWPAWQSAWPEIMGRGWPPDEVLDGSPWELVERDERRLVMESGTSPHLGVRLRREIQLAPGGPRVTIRNTMTRVSPSPHPVHIWSVSQVLRDAFFVLHLSSDRPKADSQWHEFDSKKPLAPHATMSASTLRYDAPSGSSKIGTYGSWVAGVYEDVAFVQHVCYEADGRYPDKSSVQLYACDGYAELETLSPELELPVGGSVDNTVTWVLVKGPEAAPLAELVELFSASAP
jgi:hypothetical protein